MSAAVARRVALAAQGFADRRPTSTPTRRHLAKVLAHTQLLQLDSVNVAVRAHYMPVFSRIGAYPMALLDEAAWSHSTRRPRLLIEYWAHVASLIPVDDWPLLRHRMRRFADAHEGYFGDVARQPTLLSDVLAVVRRQGAMGAGAIEDELGGRRPKSRGGWWHRSDVKRACELLFASGELTTATRRGFERHYDLTERVLPPDILGRTVADEDSARRLTRQAAVALGVATEPDLRDYYRLAPKASQQAVAELVEDGTLEPVEVEGWRGPAYRHVAAKAPRAIRTSALLCPFDPVVWRRERTQRLFGFHYRIEIYVPEPKRIYGYYVFPFLLDDEFVARVDLKSDRGAGVLRVQGAFAEPGIDTGRVVEALAAELTIMAGWLGLSGVRVGDRGDLAKPLRLRFG